MLISLNNFNKIPFASKAVKSNSQGEPVYLKKGIAYNKDNKLYTGDVFEKTKNGDEYSLYYEDGKIKTSEKNGNLYKAYYYNSDDGNRSHFFKDGTYLTYQQMYRILEKDTVQVRDYENKTRHYIMKNNENGFKNEPKVRCHLTTELRSKKIIDEKDMQLNSFENPEFNSVEEANEYFLEKYGIETDFEDLKTAHIIKQAVDTFVPLNYKGKGEKIFEGLRIENKILTSNLFGKVNYAYEINGEKLDQETASQEEIEKFAEKIKKHIEQNSKDIKTANIHMEITSTNVAPTMLKKSHDNGFHPTKFISGIAIHEFVHYLHTTENPNWFALNAKKNLTSEQLEIAKEVSGYGCTNIAEYVAEYAAGRLEGKTFSKEADELYKEFKGPDLFKN